MLGRQLVAIFARLGRWAGIEAPRAIGRGLVVGARLVAQCIVVGAGIAGGCFMWVLVGSARHMGPRDVLNDPQYLGFPGWIGTGLQFAFALFAGLVAAGAAAVWVGGLFRTGSGAGVDGREPGRAGAAPGVTHRRR